MLNHQYLYELFPQLRTVGTGTGVYFHFLLSNSVPVGTVPSSFMQKLELPTISREYLRYRYRVPTYKSSYLPLSLLLCINSYIHIYLGTRPYMYTQVPITRVCKQKIIRRLECQTIGCYPRRVCPALSYTLQQCFQPHAQEWGPCNMYTYTKPV